MSDTPVNNGSGNTPAPQEMPTIPIKRQGLAMEFVEFLIHNKAWWMTPIIIVILLMVAFILFAESSPVLPFVYTVI